MRSETGGEIKQGRHGTRVERVGVGGVVVEGVRLRQIIETRMQNYTRFYSTVSRKS
jgi:hypothetical protein